MYSNYLNQQLAKERLKELHKIAEQRNLERLANAGKPTFAQRFLAYLKKLWQRNNRGSAAMRKARQSGV